MDPRPAPVADGRPCQAQPVLLNLVGSRMKFWRRPGAWTCRSPAHDGPGPGAAAGQGHGHRHRPEGRNRCSRSSPGRTATPRGSTGTGLGLTYHQAVGGLQNGTVSLKAPVTRKHVHPGHPYPTAPAGSWYRRRRTARSRLPGRAAYPVAGTMNSQCDGGAGRVGGPDPRRAH